MNRKKNPGGFDSLICKSKEMFNNQMATFPQAGAPAILSAFSFRGKLGAAVSVITSLIVGFLTIPNNILYFIDGKHGARIAPTWTSPPPSNRRPGYEYGYIYAGVTLVVLGCLAMVTSIVLSYFAARSKQKMDDSKGWQESTGTVMACLIMMNIELLMAVIAGCMELLYRPLISDAQRLHNVECAIAVLNVVIYIMYVMTMVQISNLLKERYQRIREDRTSTPEVVTAVPLSSSSAREYVSRSVNSYNSPTSFI